MVRWYGGTVVRWYGGTVVRWYGCTVVWLYGCTVVRSYIQVFLHNYGAMLCELRYKWVSEVDPYM